MATLKLLVMDGNTQETDEKHLAAGGRPTGQHYADVLCGLRPDIECVVLHPARPGGAVLPGGLSLDAFDGIAWTGSALNIYNGGPAIDPQIELSRAAFEAGVPQFGSCWGLQVATVASGGRVGPNLRGREVGIARAITPIEAGSSHPMFEGKQGTFQAIAVHLDEVVLASPGMTVLASNAMSSVQAAVIRHGRGICWGVQYHPEYDFNEIAAVILRYGNRLIEAGFFVDMAAQDRFIADLRALHANPGRRDLAWLYGLDETVLDPALRRVELSNWLREIVAPFAAGRGRG